MFFLPARGGVRMCASQAAATRGPGFDPGPSGLLVFTTSFGRLQPPAAAVPLVGNAAYVALGMTLFGLDPTSFLFTIPSLLLIAHVVSGEFFDYHSLGQKLIVESMKTPAILLAGDGRTFALNGPARTMVDAGEIGELPLQPMTGDPGQSGVGAIEGTVAVANRWLRMEVIPVPAARAPRIPSEGGARVVLLHDVTLEHQRALELRRSVEEQAENMRHIQESHDVYLEQATRDALTGLLNRRSLDASFAAMQEQALSRGGPVTIAMVDLDDFKAINDRFGHATGDRALQTFADGLRAVCREDDRIYRLGGDEFLILTISMPQDVLEARLRDMGEGPEFLPQTAALTAVKVGFSFGTASARSDVSLEELIARADRTLYARKKPRGPADGSLWCVSATAGIH